MIVGTAGHIDHGKTALVKALTGVDADRLPEEKTRGISIELGFAYLPRPDGSVLGFVDVPGHERFMKTMLAGASGIDFVLLVIAADDGIMPQTREHLAVVELLGVTRGALVLTKCDLAAEDRLAALEAELRSLVARGPLAAAPLLRTSAPTGEGMANVLALLDEAARQGPRLSDGSAFRMAVDRSFSLQGTGTVVTGTVWSGEVAVGDRLAVSPAGLEARVRALHVQNRPAERARRGQRCGINLGRVEASAVRRGDVVLDPVLHAPTQRIDAELRLLPGEPRALRHWASVRLHHGAAEVGARVALLQEAPLQPGESGLVQLVLDAPIAAAAMDRFVIRSQDAARTMGGGRLVDLRPPQRRRRQPRRLEQLAALAEPDPAASLALQLDRWPFFVEWAAFLRDRTLGPGAADKLLAQVPHVAASAEGRTYLFAPAVWASLEAGALDEAGLFHRRFPQLLGPNAQRLVGALDPRLPPGPGLAVLDRLAETGHLAREAGVYRLPTHRLGLDRDDLAAWRRIAPLLAGEARFRPPRAGQIAEALAIRDFDVRRVLKALARQRKLVEVAPDHFFLRETIVEVARIVGQLADTSPERLFSAAQLRDSLEQGGAGVGRKVAIQLLEWFDRHALTLRRGDLRTTDPMRIARFCSEGADPAG